MFMYAKIFYRSLSENTYTLVSTPGRSYFVDGAERSPLYV